MTPIRLPGTLTHVGSNERFRRSGKATVWLLACFILAVSFFSNLFRIAPHEWFQAYQKDSESLVIGRLVESRMNGVASAAGLLGWQVPPTLKEQIHLFQYFAYTREIHGVEYRPYGSQVGLQGMALSLVDRLLPLEPDRRLAIHYGITATLTAVVLVAISMWFAHRLGWEAGLVCWLGLLISHWLLGTARNLWWSLWLFFLPMLLVALHLSRFGTRRPRSLAAVIYVGILLKSMTGYEFITAVSIMTATPLVYHHLQIRSEWKILARDLTIAASAAIAAVGSSLLILVGQLGLISGNLTEGFRSISHTLQARSYGEAEGFTGIVARSLEATPLTVVQQYLAGPYFAGRIGSISYLTLISLFAIATFCLAILDIRKMGRISSEARGIIGATWFSFTAPLSWFVIFKAHSYIHTHMNFIVWQMPFTIVGFSLCGLLIKRLRELVPQARTSG